MISESISGSFTTNYFFPVHPGTGMPTVQLKYFLLFLALIGTCSFGIGQKPGEISPAEILQLLETAEADTEKVNLYARLAGALFQSDPDSSLGFANTGLEIANRIDYKKGQGDLLINMGNAYYIKGDPPKQLDYYLKSLKVREEIGDRAGIAHCHNNIGNFYLSQGDSEKARENFEKSLEIRQSLGEKNSIAGTMNNLGNVHLQADEYEKALEYYNKALLINEETGNKHSAAITLGNIGLIYSRQENLTRALEYYQRALEIRKELNQKNGVALLNNRIGNIFLNKGQYGNAVRHFQIALKTAEEIGGKPFMETAYEGLAETYEAMGDYRTSLEYFKEYATVRDSIYNQESANAIAEMEAKYLAEKREKEREQQLREKELEALETEARFQRSRILTIALVIGFVLILILAFVLYNQGRIKQMANEELEAQVLSRTRELTNANERLEREIVEHKKTEMDLIQTNEELNTFIYKSSHDIKSPLTSIKGLVEIADADTAEGAANKQYFALINERIEHLDSILERLIQNVRMKEGNIESGPVQISDLVEEALGRIGKIGGRNEVEIKQENEVDRAFFSDKSILLIILQNLISNSIVFRKQGDEEKSWCRISFRLEEKDNLVIQVSDNGIGVPDRIKNKVFDMFYRGSLASRGTGLGLYIARNLVKKMGGKISLESEEGTGTIVTVTIPELGTKEVKGESAMQM